MATRKNAKRSLPENAVKDLLRKYGIPVPNYSVFSPEESILDFTFRFPVVLKVCSADILHKTDVGGVRLNISDYKELEEAVAVFHNQFPEKSLLIEPMAAPGVELITGLVNDSVFGMTIMVGLGGVFTEIYGDVAFRLLPVNERDAWDMLSELRAHVLFEGFRGQHLDRKAVIRLLLTLSKMGTDWTLAIQQMDLNPVFVYEDDIMVVDAKLIVGD